MVPLPWKREESDLKTKKSSKPTTATTKYHHVAESKNQRDGTRLPIKL